eukprot:TRINITY_DN65718_c0_g1_i1.p1 TRINITY_DN65718_c0_g1~~TRINITY_DN65718_c0_g1_i1.p1  ORF type:complete len:238 (+),score=54.28 TRINITY_DN65718_c0_g1_i1:36-749(+)
MLRHTTARLCGMAQHDALAILCVPRNATFEEAKASYRKLVKELHPDANSQLGKAERAEKEETFKEVSTAFARLEVISAGGDWQAAGPAGQTGQQGHDGWRGGGARADTSWWSTDGSRGHDNVLAWERQQRRRIHLAVKTLKRTQRSQHIPLPLQSLRLVSLEVVAGWVAEELKTQDLTGYRIEATMVGPVGTPCVSITGIPSRLYTAGGDGPDDDAEGGYSIRNAFRRVASFLKEPV